MTEILQYEECGCKYREGDDDYDSGDCLVERVERGDEW